MTAMRLDATTLPAACMRQMERLLGTSALIGVGSGDGSQADVLGVWCDVRALGAAPATSLVIVAAQPVTAAAWCFGDCFPTLPDGTDAGASLTIRSLTLRRPLWLFVWGVGVTDDAVRDALLGTDWFGAWAVQRGHAATDAGARELFGQLGFDIDDLQPDGASSPAAVPADLAQEGVAGLFMWGDLAPAMPASLARLVARDTTAIADLGATPLSEDQNSLLDLVADARELFGASDDLLFTKARLRDENGFPLLDLQLPPAMRALSLGTDAVALRNAAIRIVSPIWWSTRGSSVGVRGDLVFRDKLIHVDLDYPIDGDTIRGVGIFKGGASHLMGDTASIGLPDGGPSFPQEQIELEVDISKARGTLTRLAFVLEAHDKAWQLLTEPVALSLDGVSLQVTVFDPLDDGRIVVARLAAEATLGAGSDTAMHLMCSGSYPAGQLMLQTTARWPVGKLLERFVGPSPGLESLWMEDLRLGYNTVGGLFALEIDVAGPWAIADGFEIVDIRFGIEGIGSYNSRLDARMQIGGVDLQLSAAHDDGWDIFGRAQHLPIGELIGWVATKIEPGYTVPDEIGELMIDELALRAHSKSGLFELTCRGSLHLERREAEAAITISRPSTGAGLQIGGQLTIAGRQFDLVCHKDAASSRLLLSCVGGDGERVALRDLVGSDIGEQIPPGLAITFKDVFLAYASQKAGAPAIGVGAAGGAFSGFLLAADLDAAIRLSDIPLAGASLPAGFDAGVDGLRIVLASHDFKTSHLLGINADLPDGIAKLERVTDAADEPPADPDPPVIAKGFNLWAQLRLGDMRRTLSLNTAAAPPAKEAAGSAGGAVAIAGAAASATPVAAPATPASDATVVSLKATADAAPAQAGDGAAWVTLDKKLGPVDFRRIGLQYQDKALWVLLDVAISSSGLTLSLDGLGVGSPLDDFKPKFKLSGIGIDYSGGGAVEIAGAFLHDKRFDQYSGAALIKTDALKLSAIGSYAEIDGYTSMFVYAFLDKPIGGPTFFFVTGLAAAFGYNRALKAPTAVDEVESFPLVAIAMGSHPVADSSDETRALLDILASLARYLPPAPNTCFLALGVKFNSFKLIDSFALLIVTIAADDVRLKLLGLSKIVAPAAISGKPPVAEVTIGLLAEFIPGDGLLKVDGKIMPGSWVLDRACQLTGGFAFYSWFSGPHSGDFVLSVGGYHPRFIVPAHYPAVERLALNWQIDEHLSVKGSTYFALTSSAVMAGGALEARLDKGKLQAWFDLNADLLICWQPFHYDISVSIEIGASYHTFLGTVSASLGAAVHIWGPEFAGTATVDFVFVSFDVSFGAVGLQKPPCLSWPEFKTAFLPADKDVCTVSVKNGLLRTIKDSPDPTAPADARRWQVQLDGSVHASADATASASVARSEPAAPAPPAERWVIDPKHFALAINTTIPLNHSGADGALGIAAMALADFDSALGLTIVRREATSGQFDDCCSSDFRLTPIVKSVPAALWGKQSTPDLNGRPIAGAVCGFDITPRGHPEPGNSQDIRCSALRYHEVDAGRNLDWEAHDDIAASGERATSQELMPYSAARRALHALFADDAGDDPFDTRLDGRLIDELLEAPQRVALQGKG